MAFITRPEAAYSPDARVHQVVTLVLIRQLRYGGCILRIDCRLQAPGKVVVVWEGGGIQSKQEQGETGHLDCTGGKAPRLKHVQALGPEAVDTIAITCTEEVHSLHSSTAHKASPSCINTGARRLEPQGQAKGRWGRGELAVVTWSGRMEGRQPYRYDMKDRITSGRMSSTMTSPAVRRFV